MITAQSADGVQHQFPDGTDPAVVDKVMKDYATAKAPPPTASAQPVGTATDIAESGATGLAKGAAGIIGTPEYGISGGAHLLGSLLDRAIPGLGKFVEGAIKLNAPVMPRAKDANAAFSGPTGGYHVPQTAAGQLTETLGEFAPAAAMPGSIPQRLARVVVPSLGAEAGGAVGGDIGRAIGGIAGGGVELGGERIGSGIATTIAERNLPPQEKAQSLLQRAFERDKVAPENAAQAAARYPDKELSVLDTGGSNVARLGRTVHTLPGEGSEQLGKFLAERQADQHARVLKDVATSLSDGSDVYAVADDLIAQRSRDAGPLFKKAFSAASPNWSPRLQQFLDDPITTAAARKGVKIQRLEAVANGEPLKASDYSFSFDDTGEPIISWAGKGEKDIPNLRTLQSVKEGLDAMVEDFRDKTTHKLVLTKEGTAIKNFRDAYRSELKRLAPAEYSQALDAWAGPSQSKDALASGGDFLKMPPEIIAKRMKGLSDADKNFYRVGAARALQDKINDAADNADAVARVFGNKTIRTQIETVFGKEATTKFAESASAEKMATATNRAVRGNSTTADKLADIQDSAGYGEKAARGFAQGASHGSIKGGVAGAVSAVADVPARLNAFFNGMTPEVRNSLADLLTRTGENAFSAPPKVSKKSASGLRR